MWTSGLIWSKPDPFQYWHTLSHLDAIIKLVSWILWLRYKRKVNCKICIQYGDVWNLITNQWNGLYLSTWREGNHCQLQQNYNLLETSLIICSITSVLPNQINWTWSYICYNPVTRNVSIFISVRVLDTPLTYKARGRKTDYTRSYEIRLQPTLLAWLTYSLVIQFRETYIKTKKKVI
jgi:hypothetical protein